MTRDFLLGADTILVIYPMQALPFGYSDRMAGAETVSCPKCGSFSIKIPKDFKHTIYCNVCLNELKPEEQKALFGR